MPLKSTEIPIRDIERLELSDLERGAFHRLRVHLGLDPTGAPFTVPVMVARAEEEGPVVGLTAAIHGNELNGITVIQRLFRSEPVSQLMCGTLVAVPIVNPPGLLRNQREFHDGEDLNRIMPGRPWGKAAQIYAHRFFERVIRGFDVLLDLHTASFGRVNSFYIRANMKKPRVATLARLIKPQIIVHNESSDGTLRRAATEAGVDALTIEIGDPQQTQKWMVRSSRLGIQETLEHLKMIPDLEDPDDAEIVECHRSYWIYTDEGGFLDVHPELAMRVRKGELIATLYDVWGDIIRQYEAPEDGVVVGKSSNPVANPGSRILHLGLVGGV